MLMHHLSICTPEPESRVEEFYTEVMGFQKIRSVRNGKDLLLYFRLGDELLLEVIIDPDSAPYIPDGNSDGGFAHFAFVVETIGPWLEAVQTHELEITYGPELIPALKINTFLFRDPFGAVWELMEETE